MSVLVDTTRYPPLEEALIDRWRRIPVAVAVDLQGDVAQIDPAIRPLRPPGSQPRLFGRAVTALCEAPDFGAVLHALDCIEAGDVLVIAAAGDAGTAMIGEILGGQLRRRGGRGIVCDGAIRDVATLAGWDNFSVFARHVTPRGPRSAADGTVNAPCRVGGVRIHPGDLILGDDDGVVALPRSVILGRIDDAEAKMAMEEGWTASLTAGLSVRETFGLPLPQMGAGG